MKRWMSAALATGLLASPFLAPAALGQQAYKDPATGLTVTVPPGYKLTPASFDGAATSFGIDPESGSPPVAGTSKHVCQINFKATTGNAGLSQPTINRLMRTAEWRKTAVATVGNVFHVDATRYVTVQGVTGLQFDARPKFGPGHEDARLMGVLFDTAQGRTIGFCGTNRASWRTASPTFRQILSRVGAP